MLYRKTNKSFIFSGILLYACTISSPALADDVDDFLNIDDDSTEAFFRENPPTPTDLCNPQLITPLIVQFGVIPILEENLYLRTNELNNRSLLDLPIFLPSRWKGYTSTYGFSFFANITHRMHFTQNSSAISSYLNIGQSPLLDAISSSFEKVTNLLPGNLLQPARVLPLFRNFTVEQRRIGMMFHAEKRFQKIFLYCFVPIYYIERNMFASEIEQEALTEVFGRLDQESEDKMAKQHLVSDQFGLGDTRLSIDFQIQDSPMWGFNLGFFTTLPTAFAFKKGINGSTFEKIACPKSIDILDIVCRGTSPDVEQKDAVLKELEVFGFQALDNLAANVLQTPLGNGGHVGLGFAFQVDSHLRNFIKRSWANAIDFRSRISLEYLIPTTKKREFMVLNRAAAFEALGLDESPSIIISNAEYDSAYAAKLLNFFDQQITQSLFPPVFSTRVHPGFIFRYTSKTFHDSDRWYFGLGNDFWLQSKEELTNLKGPAVCALNIRAAQKPVAYQGKVWGTVAYKVLRDDIDWILSFNIDETYLKSGIGADYTIALGFEAHF